jgi:hypothetical protein
MQQELSYDDAPGWERRLGETSVQYAAFLIYRNLPPHQRTLTNAHRQSRCENQAQPDLIDSSGPSAAMKRWFQRYEWEKRAAAWDQWNRSEQDRIEREAYEALALKKRAQKNALDEVKFRRILKINEQIDNTLQSTTGLACTRQTSKADGKQVTIELDRLRQFEVLSEKLNDLEDRYFGETDKELKPGDEEENIPSIGKFEWVPDPEVPPLPDPAPPKNNQDSDEENS